jgi:hypothetical protein
MAYPFDTDAISELLEPRPAAGYVRWLASVPREEFEIVGWLPDDCTLKDAAHRLYLRGVLVADAQLASGITRALSSLGRRRQGVRRSVVFGSRKCRRAR